MSAQTIVRELLREHGPLTVDQLLTLVTEQGAITSKNPKQTIRNALLNDDASLSGSENQYVYFPGFIKGARLRVPMRGAVPDKGLLPIGPEASALLWPASEHGTRDDKPTIALEGGPVVSVKTDYRWSSNLWIIVRLPPRFWQWWADRGDADALLLSCLDGEAARFSARAVREQDLDTQEVAARDAEIREAAADIMRRNRRMYVGDLARRLLARGVYHRDPPPDQLLGVLFVPGAPFVRDHPMVAYRPDITPALWSLFGPRLAEQLLWEEANVLKQLGLLSEGDGEEAIEEGQEVGDAETPWPDPPPLPEGAAQQGYRLRVRLRWEPKVWRDLEMAGDQALEDLHLAIQDAFGWDNDHLYAFYLSGKRHDTLTEVGEQTEFGTTEPPFSHEVALAHLALKRGQKILYLFDFGDNLEHDVELVDTFTTKAGATYPRVVEVHGEAPPQYPTWEDEGDWDETGDWDEGNEDGG